MDNIPSEDQLVINELVEFWQTHNEPHKLTAHIRGTLKQGCTSLTSFFAKVRDDLRADKHSTYAASSASEFRAFLGAEYHRLYNPCVERQKANAQAKVEAGMDIDAFHQDWVVFPVSRPIRKIRETVCWRCHSPLSSGEHEQCSDCKGLICDTCGACHRSCIKMNSGSLLPDFPDE